MRIRIWGIRFQNETTLAFVNDLESPSEAPDFWDRNKHRDIGPCYGCGAKTGEQHKVGVQGRLHRRVSIGCSPQAE